MTAREQIVWALRCTAKTGYRDCTGCPYLLEEALEELGEDEAWLACDVNRIALDAADLLENDERLALAMQRELELKQAQLDYADSSAGKLREAAAQVTKIAADAAEREWISVKERLPEEHESIFAKAYGTKRWADGMFRTISDEVLACVAFDDGRKTTMTLRTHDGAWALSSIHRGHVTHWMPLPDAPEVE